MALQLKGQVLKVQNFKSKKGNELVSAKVFDGSDVFNVLGSFEVMNGVAAGTQKTFDVSASVNNGFVSLFVEAVK